VFFISIEMGTRLYPMTSSVSVMEKLAGVEPGSARTWEIIKAAEEALADAVDPCELRACACMPDGEEIGWAIFQATKGSDAARFNTFKLFGYGKFDLSLIPEEQRVTGHTTDPELCKKLLQSSTAFPLNIHEILELSSGLAWG
tara:strand:+ start:279 stop:707 length:429 start_codon:yes stop_codon:yes gene_type:complete